MHPLRRQRLSALLFLMVGLAAGVGLTLVALRENINHFYTPAQLEGVAPGAERLRVGGMVRAGSLRRQDRGLRLQFVLEGGGAQVLVHYEGILPDLFREGQAAIVAGRLESAGVVRASRVLAKHDENYRPPPLADMYPGDYRPNSQK